MIALLAAGAMGCSASHGEPIVERAGALATAGASYCAIVDAHVVCFGLPASDGLGRAEVAPETLLDPGDALPAIEIDGHPRASRLSANSGGYCALLVDGSVVCWGHDLRLECGPRRQPAPQQLVLPTSVDVVGSAFDGCAIAEDGSVRCWGCGDATRMGLEGEGDVVLDRPHLVGGVDGAVAFVSRTCVRRRDDGVRCWGGTPFTDALLGPGSHTARAIDELHGATRLTEHVDRATERVAGLLVMRDGRVLRRVLDPARGADETGWQPIDLATEAVTIGSDLPCVLDRFGGLRCWGVTEAPESTVRWPWADAPHAAVPTSGGAVAFAAQPGGGCILRDDDALECWGTVFHPDVRRNRWPPQIVPLPSGAE